MNVITSTIVAKGVRMSDQIAKEDMTDVNELGQTVLLVAKGQPIPVDLLPGKKAAGKKVDAPAENKARKAPVSSKSTKKS